MSKYIFAIRFAGWVEILWSGLWVVTLLLLLASCVPTFPTYPPPTETEVPAATEPAATEEPSATPEFTVSPACIITGDTVYMRTGAGMEYEAFRVLRRGEVVTVLVEGEWNLVQIDGRVGYVLAYYCK